MTSLTRLVGLMALAFLAAVAAQADDAGMIMMAGGSSSDPHAATNGAMWMDTGSGPQLIPDRWSDALGMNSDRSADINVEVLASASPTNLQRIATTVNPAFTSIWLLSIPNPNLDNIPNSAWWDMTFGGPPGMWLDPLSYTWYVPGSTGTAYFRVRAWTGLYDTVDAALAAGAYVADTGVYLGVTCAGSIMPIPSLNASMPAMILRQQLRGDANLDGKVDINDLSLILTNYDKTGMSWSHGDFNGDGKVDINDLSTVLTNYDRSVAAAGAGIGAVPEPGTWALLGAAASGLLAIGRWKRR